jgi:uncharacterized repeat protein (TIGR03803 family)
MRPRNVSAASVLALVLGLAALATQSAHAQTFTVLYNFTGGSDGGTPLAAVIDVNSNLYGTTYNGAAGFGTVFKVNQKGKEVVLHSFNYTDGGYLFGSLIRDKAGNLYGTTELGGTSGSGTVFKLDTSHRERVLYNFAGGADGASPIAGLVRDGKGSFYSTTSQGGTANVGTVFKLDAGGVKTVLYSFTGGLDGAFPLYGSLVMDSVGNLYGTTNQGGASGFGTVFKVSMAGKETVLYSFKGSKDGEYPRSGLVRDKNGNFYGTTNEGGASSSGTVFKLSKSGKETVLYSFAGGADGMSPLGGLVRDTTGSLYGTTQLGGTAGNGTVFKVSGKGRETVLHSFNIATDGGFPSAGLVRDNKGNLYGTAGGGGTGGSGTVFKLTP